jgi:hypothetical protein
MKLHIIYLLLLVPISILGNVDVRAVLINNSANDVSTGTMTIQMEAKSNTTDVSIQYYRVIIETDLLFKAQYQSSVFSNQLFNSSDYDIVSEEYKIGTGPKVDFLDVEYSIASGGTPVVISSSEWTTIYSVSLTYNLSEGSYTSFSWRLSNEYYIQDINDNEVSGVRGDIPQNISLNPSTPLPVELSLFSASVSDQTVELIWETVTEVDNYGFEIERKITSDASASLSINENSAEGESGNWNLIRFIEGHGNSNSPKYYSFTDSKLDGSGKYLYRLKQIDIDGEFEYSNVVEAVLKVPSDFVLNQNYPNPFNPSTTIKFTLHEDSPLKLSVFDIIGKEVVELLDENMSAGYHSVNFDGSSFNSGIYFYRLETDKTTEIKKMMLIK